MSKEHVKISVIGAGAVGASTAFSLTMAGLANELVVVDLNEELSEGETMDLNHGASFINPMTITAGDYDKTANSDILVITAGAAQKPGESRINLVGRNIKIFESIIPQVTAYSPDAILLVVSNPVDIQSLLSLKLSHFPKERIIGSGTVLDSSRLKYEVARRLDVSPHDVQAYVLGEHGDTSFVSWDLMTIQGIPIETFAEQKGIEFTPALREDIENDVRNAAYEVIQRKGNTSYAIAMSVTRIVKAILKDEHCILPVSTFLEDNNGISNAYLSLPAIVGREGVVQTLNIELKGEEREKFNHSASALQDVIAAHGALA